MQRLMCLAAVVFALAVLPACSAGSLLSSSPVPVAYSVSGGAPAIGHTTQMKAVAQMSDGSSQDVTAQTSWSSSDTTLATVSSTGVVTGVASGVVNITGTYQGFSGFATLTIP